MDQCGASFSLSRSREANARPRKLIVLRNGALIAGVALLSLVLPKPIAENAVFGQDGVIVRDGFKLTSADGFSSGEITALLLDTDKAKQMNDARPIDGKLESVGEFQFLGDREDLDRSLDCLAAAGYYEAGDDTDGQRAVMQVVLNRARHAAYPGSICEVVFQGSHRSTGCQFTFTCDGSLRRKPGISAWERAKRTAVQAVAGEVDERIGTATHYHANYVLPYWAPSLRKVVQIGAHVFYRFPDAPGGSRSFRNKHAGSEPFRIGDPTAETPISDAVVALADQTVVDADGAAQISETFLVTAPVAVDRTSPSTVVDALATDIKPGRWAVIALNKCGRRTECLYLGYGDTSIASQNRPLPSEERELPLFALVKDSSSGMTVAYWNCDRVARPNQKQCLPKASGALARLLRDR